MKNPQQIDSEKQVLGYLLIDGTEDVMADITVKLSPQHFYTSEHRDIFDAIRSLFYNNRTVNILSVSEQLKQNGTLDSVGGNQYLTDLASGVMLNVSLEDCADMVKKTSEARNYIMTFERASVELTTNWGDIDGIIQKVENEIFNINRSNIERGMVLCRDIVDEEMAKIARMRTTKELPGLKSGYLDLDMNTCGFMPGETTILAARPSVGKTAFMLNVMVKIAINEKRPVMIFSLETPQGMLVNRLLCILSGVDFMHVKSGRISDQEWDKLVKASKQLKDIECNIIMCDDTNLSPSKIRSRVHKEIIARPNLGMVFVDYLQLMIPDGKPQNDNSDTASISRGLKLIAMDYNIPLMVISQLTREPAKRDDKMPQLSDLRNSGAIEQDADVVMFLHRPDYYESADLESPGAFKETILNIAKQRNGPRCNIKLMFMPESMRFGNASREEKPVENEIKVYNNDDNDIIGDIVSEFSKGD